MTAAPELVADRLAEVRRRVEQQGRDPGTVRIVAVTKGHGSDTVAAAHAAGLFDMGENYADELLDKASDCPPGTRWHFMGAIQRNKVRRLSAHVTHWHTVDRPEAAKAVAAAAPGSEVLLQVNVTGAANRPGCHPQLLPELVEEVRTQPVDLSGLMAVGPAGDPTATRDAFRWLAEARSRLGLRELSMGMSGDYEIAVAEGATTLRLGQVLFGPRPGAGGRQG